jgi:hypothetical protein
MLSLSPRFGRAGAAKGGVGLKTLRVRTEMTTTLLASTKPGGQQKKKIVRAIVL